MSERPNCTSCAFYTTEPPRQDGVCHLNPPVPVVVGMDTRYGAPRPVMTAYYPGVAKIDWCSHHKGKITIQ